MKRFENFIYNYQELSLKFSKIKSEFNYWDLNFEFSVLGKPLEIGSRFARHTGDDWPDLRPTPSLNSTSTLRYTILASKTVSNTVAEVSAKWDTAVGTEVRA